MSATGRGSIRQPFDEYNTPSWCVHRLLEAWDPPGGHWLEPAAGDGAIIKAVNEVRKDVMWSAIEMRDTRAALAKIPVNQLMLSPYDFLKYSKRASEAAHWDVIITNPPYSLAQEFIEHSIELADHVAMLLRVNFLASAERAEFMQKYPPDVYVLPNRPNFRRGEINPVNGKPFGGDATEYAWLVWEHVRTRDYGSFQVLGTTSKSVRCGKETK